jgi:YfiH family protein
MINRRGVAFTSAADGDMNDPGNRAAVAARLGIRGAWALLTQVHGSTVHIVEGAGAPLEGDGLVTTTLQLPIAIRTADCVGAVFSGPGAVGVAHGGWRGVASGVLERVAETMVSLGSAPERVTLGPFIGPCCFEVGPEVLAAFPGAHASTTWGTPSVDLAAAVRGRLTAVQVDELGGCTRCGGEWFSHRRDSTSHRLAAIGWLP